MKLRFTLPAVLMAALLLATACGNGNDDNKDRYATNKAGERLVEKIIFNDTSYIHFIYNTDGVIKTYSENDGSSARIWTFEKKGDILYTCVEEKYKEYQDSLESSFELNKFGFIVLDRGWAGNDNYRLTYDESGQYLENIFEDNVLLHTFQWKDDNIFSENVSYIAQANLSNIDWCSFWGTWQHDIDDREQLVPVVSVWDRWGFSGGYLGNKNKKLPSEDAEFNYTYDFTNDGLVSTICKINKQTQESFKFKITYLKK